MCSSFHKTNKIWRIFLNVEFREIYLIRNLKIVFFVVIHFCWFFHMLHVISPLNFYSYFLFLTSSLDHKMFRKNIYKFSAISHLIIYFVTIWISKNTLKKIILIIYFINKGNISIVWYWNEPVLSDSYLNNSGIFILFDYILCSIDQQILVKF